MSLSVNHLTVVRGTKKVLHDITFSFPSQGCTALIGPNGSGKTTLLRTLCGIESPAQGSIAWKGTPLTSFSRTEWSQTVAFVPQTPVPTFAYTVREIVEMGLYVRDGDVDRALNMLDIFSLQNHPITEVSGGERQRAYIARALAADTPLLLLDEPTAHLDIGHAQAIWQALHALAEKGKAVVVALHDLAAAERHADTVLLLDKGHLVASGPFSQVLSQERLQTVYGTETRFA